MIVATLVLGTSLVILGAADGATPSALVAKLGSGQFAEREAAAQRLEGLGAEAIAALRTARNDRDPEVRARAAILLDRIEKRLLVRATLVALDAENLPLTDVIRDLGVKTNMTPLVDGDGNVPAAIRRVTAHSRSPVPYWSAIDQICTSSGLRSTQAPQGLGGQGGAPVLLFSPGENPAPPPPTSDSGPFRIKLVKLDYHRERVLEVPPGQPASPEPRHYFSARLQVLAEPRLLISQAGPARLTDAVDDQGRSLLPTARSSLQPDAIEIDAMETSLGGPFPLSLPLHYPEPAGRSIRRLRGSVPVSVAARKADPLVIPLTSAVGRTYQSSDASVTVVAIRSDPNDQQSTIELTIRPRSSEGTAGEILMPRPQPGAPDFLDKQVEILDVLGRPFLHFPQDMTPVGDGFRVVLMLAATEGNSKPSTLRFYGLIRTSTEIPFDFKDVSW